MEVEEIVSQLKEWNEDEEDLEDMDDKELKRLYDEKYESLNDDSVFHPNGRDYDSENEDGI